MPVAQIISGEGYITPFYPIPTKHTVSHIVESFGGEVSLNPHNNNLDNAHLVLKGSLSSNEHYIKCTNQVGTTTKFSINGDGSVYAADYLPIGGAAGSGV